MWYYNNTKEIHDFFYIQTFSSYEVWEPLDVGKDLSFSLRSKFDVVLNSRYCVRSEYLLYPTSYSEKFALAEIFQTFQTGPIQFVSLSTYYFGKDVSCQLELKDISISVQERFWYEVRENYAEYDNYLRELGWIW